MIRRSLQRSGIARAFVSILAGLCIAGIAMKASGYNPLEAYAAIWTGAAGLSAGPPVSPSDLPLGSGHVNSFQAGQSLARMTPLLFTGLAVALGLKAGLFNIGGQGQMTVGALAGAVVGTWGPETPSALHVLGVLAAGAAAGAGWGAMAGLLRATRGVHEVISTIMLNFVALDLVNYLVEGALRDPSSENRQTIQISHSAFLQPLVPHSNLTTGILLALVAMAATSLMITRTALGYRIRAVGLGTEAARAAGIPVGRVLVITMALSGALAGIAGAVEVMGVHHRYVDGVAGTYGFDGIAVALLGGLGGGIAMSALFFGALASGSAYMESVTNVPAPVAGIVQAVVILFVAMRHRRAAAASVAPASTDGKESAHAPS